MAGGWLPQTGGVRPQLLVMVDLDSLQGRHPRGGDTDSGPLDPEACQRLAYDSTLTRVLVTRQPTNHHSRWDDNPGGHNHPIAEQRWPAPNPGTEERVATVDLGADQRPPAPDPTAQGLEARLRTAMTLLPPALGGAPSQPLEVGRASRVVTPPNPAPWPSVMAAAGSLGVSAPGLVRRPPPAHWLHGGPTNLTNLVLLCRAHHRAVHEGGWQLARAPDGRLTATPPHPTNHTHDTPHSQPRPDRATQPDHGHPAGP